MADAFYVTDSLESGPFAWGFVFLQSVIYHHLREDSTATEKILQCRYILKTFPEQFASEVASLLIKFQIAYAQALDLYLF